MMKDLIYVFDLDGVITNPENSSVNQSVVGRIRDILTDGEHVAVNTGRSFGWVEQHFIGGLGEDKSAFDRLYIVCEKGGESMLWQEGRFVSQPSRFALNREAYDIVKDTFNSHADDFSSMIWDDTKRTMATIEKKPDAELDAFREQRQPLTTLLHEKVEGYEVKIDATTIATDVESPRAGKHAGAELIYGWVDEHTSVGRDNFVCFGDSASDYEMARYFAQQGAATTFVFVGKPDAHINEDERVELVRPSAQYDAGTAEYLEQHHAGTHS